MPKQDTTLDTVYRMRMTEEQKELLFAVSPSRSASEFWRELVSEIAIMLLKLRTGRLTPAEFGARLEQFAQAYLDEAVSGSVKITIAKFGWHDATAEQDEP